MRFPLVTSVTQPQPRETAVHTLHAPLITQSDWLFRCHRQSLSEPNCRTYGVMNNKPSCSCLCSAGALGLCSRPGCTPAVLLVDLLLQFSYSAGHSSAPRPPLMYLVLSSLVTVNSGGRGCFLVVLMSLQPTWGLGREPVLHQCLKNGMS